MRRMLSRFREGNRNEELVRSLEGTGAISSPEIINAFSKVDRGFFLEHDDGDPSDLEEGVAYIDMPMRHGLLHLSAPSIYGMALESLDLDEGQSFLNVGSGTGYLSSLAANILGACSVQFGIELRPELVDHARAKLDALGHRHVTLVHGDCFGLDPETSMRFDRIYIGAGASQHSAALILRFLEVGGVCVGPFMTEPNSQRILRIRRVEESRFEVHSVLSVQFTVRVGPLLMSSSLGQG
uniref:Protein-L-isoaspartate O-methyltransferase n=1 Tax=Haptolina brevifila TaxID=156173 RepID=A0A7S2GH62_9EUKA